MKLVKYTRFNKLVRDQRGAGMVEYIILVGVVALLAIVAFKYFNTSVRTKVNQQGDTVNNINGNATATQE
jgi:pilus assembly protein Flp/PilA